MIQKGELAKKEKSKAIQEILDKLEKSETEFKEKTSAVVKETLNKLGYATQKDIQELKGTISDLKKRISAKLIE